MTDYRGILLAFFALLWSALCVSFEQSRVRGLVSQFTSRHYLTAPGQITRSEITVRSVDSPINWKSDTVYGVDIRYEYEARGRRFSGSRFRYNTAPSSSSDAKWAKSLVAAHPVGSKVQVFYNPENPADAVLATGLGGSDFVLVLFLTPFNCVMLALWLLSASWLRRTLLNPIAGGVSVHHSGHYIRVRLPRFRPEAAALILLGTMALIGAFSLGTHPPFKAAALMTCLIFAAAGSLYVWLLLRATSGTKDLVIDCAARTVSVPKTFGRKETIVIGFSDIAAVETEVIEHWSFEAGLSLSYSPTIRVREGHKGLRLANWYDRRKAEVFVDWLRAQLESHTVIG